MDDLNKPLGQGPSPKTRLSIGRLAAHGLAAILVAMLCGFALWVAVVRDPLGGEPVAEAPIAVQTAEATRLPSLPESPSPPALSQPQEAAPKTVTIIDGSSGKRQEVVIGSSESKRSSGDPRVLEQSRHGPIPRISSDGLRPSDIYAHKRSAAKADPDGPQIAIVVGGLGVSATATANALSKLPSSVTFAFTPYGADLDTLVSQAREKGHEVLLQVPMEPHDYPDNDPGPQTLLSSLSAEQNIDRLHWLFSRMQGYVGMINYMGSRFASSDHAIAPVLREASRRGLIYVEDGSIARSQAGQIAGANKLPYARAEVVIDAVPSAVEIDNALKRLETLARGGNVAVGYSSALPASIDRIAKWAKSAQGRGIVLVPITAAAIRPRST
ncbi:divergent polysaccharide deacetylase family protein [Pseudorhodoplanes sp.]|uniref:divergent polysaccharide deacetylase family protein n=1 Tax=Pseudorhodoplanes sp. TaxID=1934341 RepID=UPI002C6CB151|nr:divergent polysaccharide deacetylase family protein [Pseudorhodoplanes sp.]HWV40488.1 divergent polysaccharide deacetylase family protein [Pseudorhodoplanes sp.]